MIDENDIERIYSQQLHTELINETKATATKLIELYPNYFGLSNLINNFEQQPIHESITQAMRNTHFAYIDNDINFDHALDWVLVWRQLLSFKALAERYGQEQVVTSVKHTRARKVIDQIYLKGLDQYMQWFPWSWFSNMQFIGAGGFSAVYAVTMTPAYDFRPVRMALKIVDDKLLNEAGITVCESTGDLMMVMKCSNSGNLEDHMRQLPLGDLDLKTITGTLLRLAANLADLHKAGMCHRNVHPRNIVCTDSDYFLVDCRFATPAKESSSVTTLTKAVYGRLPYIAPEVREGIYTEKSDVYSLGIIIWQLVSKVIFPCPDALLENKIAAAEDHVYRIEPVPGLPRWYEALYTACLEPKPKNRPDAHQICSMLQPIHNALGFSVPLDPRVAGYIVTRKAEVANHLKKLNYAVSDSTSRLYTLSSLPSTQSLVLLSFKNQPFQIIWNSI
ncbi:hypothetical protein G6F46_000261 [Rhizopus delemar]|uniref:Protein kinase domain-containing protein n=2 Tax=Rhizopus TaxID=4842 RepID=A0A9P6ZE14_9FUNG|nr:hypothetical protein G6F55_005230 [Rhizopus delemar]KAG1554260.1 hypothetical protein G6F51_000060 [Rhizopus arrhizus]KAG1505594.1 hypothetical protein G6F54_000209 [Rhizopus delemar]KAG1518905.1 hypothetical protein G6F53_000214 [Rhizopus delemar]KAG1527604.1 hypothetical protein G6F52_001391 [Rhizopus delemar]